MIENEDGLVAIKHYNSNPANAEVSGTQYFFIPKYNVSMSWVKKEHVDALLQIRAKICCGNTAQKFLYANPLDVCLWETGERC